MQRITRPALPGPARLPRAWRGALLAGATLALPALAPAQTGAPDGPRLWLNPGVYSHHFDRGKNLRDSNWGFGGEWWLTREQAVVAGSFINSNDRRSHYAAWMWRPLNTEWAGLRVGAGLAAGLFDGYPNYRDGAWFPLAMPVLTLEYGRVGVNLWPTPRIAGRTDAALSFQFKVGVW